VDPVGREVVRAPRLSRAADADRRQGTMTRPDPFARTYAQARAGFLAAAAGTRLESHPEPLRGVELETLAMDVARLGADAAEALLIVSSGCHGVEGYCGSGAQVALLQDETFRARAHEAGVALLFIHALNPWGFSHARRVTHEGVDLNRNFVDFSRPAPRNPGYDQLAPLLLPAQWPPSADNERQLMAYGASHGMAALQAAISSGQYGHPDGLFYGGNAPTWSQSTLRTVLRQHASRCLRLGWIDLHSGLGESGVGERIFAARDDDGARHRAQACWGDHVTFTENGSSTSSEVHGSLWQAAYDECPQADYAGITLEFGTQPLAAVLQALRHDHWVARRRDAHGEHREPARAAMRDAFFTDTPEWKQAVLAQTRAAAVEAIVGMAGWR
jgi:hypothetical protein